MSKRLRSLTDEMKGWTLDTGRYLELLGTERGIESRRNHPPANPLKQLPFPSRFRPSSESAQQFSLPVPGKLIGEAESLQNSPAQGLHPKEDLASTHVMALLAPYTKEQGGPLTVERVTFSEGRGNLIVTYPGVRALNRVLLSWRLQTVLFQKNASVDEPVWPRAGSWRGFDNQKGDG